LDRAAADHTGVQVGTREYAFSNAGVVIHTPLEAGPQAIFKESIEMGEASMQAVNAAVGELRRKFAPGSYDLVRQNCNHFSEALVRALFDRGIPAWINRSARLGSSFAPKDTSPGNPGSEDADGESSARKKKGDAVAKKPSTERKVLTDKQKALLSKIKKKDAAASAARGQDDEDVAAQGAS